MQVDMDVWIDALKEKLSSTASDSNTGELDLAYFEGPSTVPDAFLYFF